MLLPLDASFASVQKGRRKMFIHPNHSVEYRNWAYCCARIRRLTKDFDYFAAGRAPAGAYYSIKANGKAAYNETCKKKCAAISRKLVRYTQLRDKLAAELGNPEDHLLQIEDILQLVGNVIETTPRHGKKRRFTSLLKCSPDGSCIDKRFDAYVLLSFGYGK